MDDIWREDDTTPGAVEAALRKLFAQRHKEERAYVPARVMNMVVIVDKDFRGEIENRLQRVGRFHPSRLVLRAGGGGGRRGAAAGGGAGGWPRGCGSAPRTGPGPARSPSGASASSC